MKTFAFNFYPYERKEMLVYLYEKAKKGYILVSFSFEKQSAIFVKKQINHVHYGIEIRGNIDRIVDKYNTDRQEFLDTCLFSGWKEVYTDMGVSVYLSEEEKCPTLLFDYELTEAMVVEKKQEYLALYKDHLGYKFARLVSFISLIIIVISFCLGLSFLESDAGVELLILFAAFWGQYLSQSAMMKWMQHHLKDKELKINPSFPEFIYILILSFLFTWKYPWMITITMIYSIYYIYKSFTSRNSIFINIVSRIIFLCVTILYGFYIFGLIG